jgi:ATP-dependent Clp protease protease subunit
LLAILDSRQLTPAQKRKGGDVLPRIENRLVESGGKKKKTATMYLFEEVAWWSPNSARNFQQTLSQLDAEEIHLHINSPGGSVFEGVTIYNLLAAHPADVIVHIDGLAASIASVIALCGDRIEIAENAMVMIHDPSVIAWGNAETMRRNAEILDRIKDAILNTYEERTNLKREELAQAMADETWYSADEAVTAGFASEKVTAVKAAALWDPGDFEGLPEAAMKLGKALEEEEKEDPPPAPPAPELKGSIEDVAAAADLIASIRKSHGL